MQMYWRFRRHRWNKLYVVNRAREGGAHVKALDGTSGSLGSLRNTHIQLRVRGSGR